MPIVDSHCHVSLAWYEPVEVLLAQMDRAGVDKAVFIQIMGQYDNDYQAECVTKYPGRFASVVLVDTGRSDAARSLERLAEQGASGVRIGPSVRSPGDDPLAIWRAADRLGLAVSCGGTAAAFASDEFARLFVEFPRLPIVIEHLGSINRPDETDPQNAIRRRVFGLSRFPNAYIKIPGLGEFCKRALPVVEPFPFIKPIPPLIEEAYRSFGPDRMMWGSDYPPVSSREGYANSLRLPMEQLADKSEQDRAKIFGETALKVFPVRG